MDSSQVDAPGLFSLQRPGQGAAARLDAENFDARRDGRRYTVEGVCVRARARKLSWASRILLASGTGGSEAVLLSVCPAFLRIYGVRR